MLLALQGTKSFLTLCSDHLIEVIRINNALSSTLKVPVLSIIIFAFQIWYIYLKINIKTIGWGRSVHLIVFWILFENVMSLHRTKATFIGLLEAGRVNKCVVTEKLGDALRMKMPGKACKKPRIRIGDRYITKNCLFWFVSILLGKWFIYLYSRLNFNVESGCILWSLVLQLTSSSVDAMTLHLGTTTTTYSYSSNPSLSSLSA